MGTLYIQGGEVGPSPSHGPQPIPERDLSECCANVASRFERSRYRALFHRALDLVAELRSKISFRTVMRPNRDKRFSGARN
jgi:hypothetical protein